MGRMNENGQILLLFLLELFGIPSLKDKKGEFWLPLGCCSHWGRRERWLKEPFTSFLAYGGEKRQWPKESFAPVWEQGEIKMPLLICWLALRSPFPMYQHLWKKGARGSQSPLPVSLFGWEKGSNSFKSPLPVLQLEWLKGDTGLKSPLSLLAWASLKEPFGHELVYMGEREQSPKEPFASVSSCVRERGW